MEQLNQVLTFNLEYVYYCLHIFSALIKSNVDSLKVIVIISLCVDHVPVTCYRSHTKLDR